MARPQTLEFACEITLENPEETFESAVFEEALLEAVDSALSMLGDQGKSAVYKHLNENFGINKQEIPHEVEAFGKALESIFGQAARLIEMRIISTLHQKIPAFLFSADDGFSFVGYVESLRLFL
jgi:hypothetical protein